MDEYKARYIVLYQNLVTLKSRTYGITLKIYKGEEEIERKRFDYDICATIYDSQPGRPYWYLSFAKSGLFYNRHDPDLISEHLNTYIAEAMTPIVVGVTKQNFVYEKNLRHEQLCANWQAKKEVIRKKYEGETVERLFEVMDSVLKNPYIFWEHLKREYFWSLFFHPIHDIESDATIDDVIEISLFPYKLTEVTGTLHRHPQIEETDNHHISFKGAKTVPSTLYERANKVTLGGKEVEVDLSIDWKLDSTCVFIKHIEMSIVYKIKKGTEYEVLRRVEWSSYTIAEELREIEVEKVPTTWFGKLIDSILNI